jgi:hypothetical protein
VQVALEQRAQGGPRRGERGIQSRSKIREVRGDATGHRLRDHLEGRAADPLRGLEPPVGHSLGELVVGPRPDHLGGLAERLRLERAREIPLEPEGDLPEGIDGAHGFIVLQIGDSLHEPGRRILSEPSMRSAVRRS